MKFETPLAARAAVRALTASKIRELYNEGVGRPDILPFWVGEPDEPTPEFIRRAGIASIEAGEVFYTHNLGIPELRDALAAYVSKLHDRKVQAAEIAVTSAGVNALMLASQLIVDPGDTVVEVVPLWPNLQEQPKILGARVTTVALDFSERGWTLDLDRLLGALKPGTRALYLNSPNNPTGWTVTRPQQEAILAHCRKHGIWIFADDAYERLYFEGAAAPSFLDIAEGEDRLISTNTFSKSWLMTGWRLGWLVVPPTLTADLGKLIEYNTSCAPVFVQRAGIAALEGGEPVVARTRERFRAGRDFLVSELKKIPRVSVASPTGAMYAFFRIDGVADSLAFCKALVRDHGLGLAPGSAFGPEGEGFVRWCFAASKERLADGVARLARAMA
ncbi:MAG TPA: pyridoxal phosphate-dependent aminotransferase [Burkholderiales bacterium]|nr:pyridoxal phosphate-dependent aminotransferase [Burkholderiales bacterium]